MELEVFVNGRVLSFGRDFYCRFFLGRWLDGRFIG